LWPPVSVEYAEYETAGGIITLPRYKNIAEIRLILEDKETKPIKCTLTVNPEVSEVLLSDYATDELQISVISFRKGLWRLKDEPLEKTRESVPQEFW